MTMSHQNSLSRKKGAPLSECSILKNLKASSWLVLHFKLESLDFIKPKFKLFWTVLNNLEFLKTSKKLVAFQNKNIIHNMRGKIDRAIPRRVVFKNFAVEIAPRGIVSAQLQIRIFKTAFFAFET